MKRLLLVFVLFLMGCPPNTPIRRAALVPRPNVPANHGAPIGGKGIRGFGQMNSLRLSPVQTPLSFEELLEVVGSEGAAGLWIPNMQFGGGFWGAPSENISLGAQLLYTNLDLADRNLIGVPEFPEEHQDESLIMGGLGVRGNFPLGKFTPAIIFEANVVSIPQAVFLCDNGCNPTVENPIPTYTFQRLDRELFVLPNLALHFTFSPIEYVHVLAMLGGTRGVKNIGFDPDINNLENDTLEGYIYGYAGAGLEGRYEFVYATFVVFAPFGQPSEIKFGASTTFSVGVVYSFGKKDQKKDPAPARDTEPTTDPEPVDPPSKIL